MEQNTNLEFAKLWNIRKTCKSTFFLSLENNERLSLYRTCLTVMRWCIWKQFLKRQCAIYYCRILFTYLRTSMIYQFECFQLQVIESAVSNGLNIRTFITLINNKSMSRVATGFANSAVKWHAHGSVEKVLSFYKIFLLLAGQPTHLVVKYSCIFLELWCLIQVLPWVSLKNLWSHSLKS